MKQPDKYKIPIADDLMIDLKESHERTAFELIKCRLAHDALGIGLWDMEIVKNDPYNPENIQAINFRLHVLPILFLFCFRQHFLNESIATSFLRGFGR